MALAGWDLMSCGRAEALDRKSALGFLSGSVRISRNLCETKPECFSAVHAVATAVKVGNVLMLEAADLQLHVMDRPVLQSWSRKM